MKIAFGPSKLKCLVEDCPNMAADAGATLCQVHGDDLHSGRVSDPQLAGWYRRWLERNPSPDIRQYVEEFIQRVEKELRNGQ